MTDALSELARERRETARACAAAVEHQNKKKRIREQQEYKAVRIKLLMHTPTRESLEALRVETVRLLVELYQLDPATMFRTWAQELDD